MRGERGSRQDALLESEEERKQGNKSFLWKRQVCCLSNPLPLFFLGKQLDGTWGLDYGKWLGGIWPFPGRDHAHLPCDPHLGIPPVLPNAEAIREVGSPWMWQDMEREEAEQGRQFIKHGIGYYMNKFMDCGFSSGMYTEQHNDLLLNNENSSLQKGFEFLLIWHIIILLDQIRSLLYSWSPQNRRGHTTFPSGSPLLESSGQALSRTLYPHRTNLRCLW